jgi:UDP-N-acetylmuramoyl-L-alanyl-D-glutamate--2,6-diaminopimelate ligase
MARKLGDLLQSCGIPTPDADFEVTGVVYDSRMATEGNVFVAIDGFHVDGADYAQSAVSRGAGAVVAARPIPGVPAGVPVIVVENTRLALAGLAAELAGHPARKLNVVGITGTDGKTTTSTMIGAGWRAAGIRAATSTTVEFCLAGEVISNAPRENMPGTTREAPEVQERLQQCLDAGCTHVALETSSHALELERVAGVDYAGAVYTRITSEHLELHGSLEGYLAAKAKLLTLLDRSRDPFAVFDYDDPNTVATLIGNAPSRRLTYSASGAQQADLRAVAVTSSPSGAKFTAQTPWGDAEITLQIPGSFNVANALAALAATVLSGATLEQAAKGISQLEQVNGRMERVDLGQPFTVVVDYAHTSDSLEKVLRELRPITAGTLWVVFGSAGERDLEKRPRMGDAAARLADQIVVTDEDPREEDRLQILEQIAHGAEAAGAARGKNLTLIADRPQAVDYVISRAQPGDTVLLAGKGHETSILGSGGAVPYLERKVAETALRARFGKTQ